MEEQNITELESLSIITQMINTAKLEQKDNGMGWIIWGWLLFATSTFTFFNQIFGWFNSYFFWNCFGIASMLLFAYFIIKKICFNESSNVKTYTSELLKKLNIGFFICIVLIIAIMNKGINPVYGFAVLLTLYGFWIFIYGSALNFKPSIFGAYFTWACALAAAFVTDFKYTMLLHSLAILVGYIIPGHLARIAFNKTKNKQ